MPSNLTWNNARTSALRSSTFLAVEKLDRRMRRENPERPPDAPHIRLAITGSCTLAHLHAGIRVAGLRHNIAITTHQGAYGQYLPELLAPCPELRDFHPDFILIALDAAHLTGSFRPSMTQAEVDNEHSALISRLRQCWRGAKSLGAQAIQQAALPTLPPLLGQNDHLLPAAPAEFLAQFNRDLRRAAAEDGVMVLGIDTEATRLGIDALHDPVLWHRAKQEISPAASPLYGDLVARLIAARLGKSAKCLVLDLDNTLWGGVIGDDGLEGIVLGQGSAEGEAFLSVQSYAKALSARGIALAVCSKNDDAVARSAFEKHPEMLLRLPDIACFVANWQDKASNIRKIAETLSLGLDSLVFLDDNPAERDLVRRELPMVRVLETPEEPALVPAALAASGWFESVAVTAEDFARSAQYAANAARAALKDSATDMGSYLESLAMRLIWRPFDRIGLSRITQLINKTNQFNLTTRRYSEEQVAAMLDDPAVLGLQFRLIDRFGDNGMIGVVIMRDTGASKWEIDTWLMSCRVLGRGVEQAMIGVVADAARKRGAAALIGRFIPSGRNEMVRGHYENLGFTPTGTVGDNAETCYALALEGFAPEPTRITIEEG